MANFNQTLNKLSSSFSVCDIMIPINNLLCAINYEEAINLLGSTNYDIIPIKNKKGRIVGFIDRENMQTTNIDFELIISDATSILDLINHLVNKKFIFVFCGNNIGGFIHFSDLNNEIVKLPLYLLFESVENNLISKLNDKISEVELTKILDQKRLTEVNEKMGRLKASDADLNWFSLLYFREIIKLSESLSIIKIKGDEIDIIAKVRNLISHAGTPLVEKQTDVKKILDAIEICHKILQQIV